MARYSTTYSSTRVHFSAYLIVKIRGLMSLKSEDIQKAGVLFAKLPSSCWLQNVHRSMTLLDNRSPLTSNPLQAWPPFFPSVLVASSRPRRRDFFLGTASKPALFQRTSESPPKKRCSSSPAAPARKIFTQTNARHGPKNGQARR